jgi:glutaredoxin
MTAPPVTVYALSTCAWSAKAKAFFRQRHIEPFIFDYDKVGADLQQKMAAEMRRFGADGFPMVKIGRHVVKGYAPEVYERLLKAG